MREIPDLLVIGAGLSGLMAAYEAAEAGLRVKVIAKGLGSMHWSAGTVDVLGYAAGDKAVSMPLQELEGLQAVAPHHPYVVAGAEAVTEALSRFVALAKELGLPYEGAEEPGRNLWLPSPVGAARPVYLAPQGQRYGDLALAEPIVVVGFEGLRDFYPWVIAENLRKQGHRARGTVLPFALLSERRDANTVQLAQELDELKRVVTLARALKEVVEPGERVGLPALVGLDRHGRAMEVLQEELGTRVFEIPTLPPSVPGMRLYRALRSDLEGRGVEVEIGMEAVGYEAKEENGGFRRLLWVETATSARPLKHRARAFLLATGGLLGGGFDSNHEGRVWERVFDLPLAMPQNREDWFRPKFLDPAGHPVFQGGVSVDREFRPVSPEGKRLFANLWAAGNGLRDCDGIRERSREGIAIVTGIAAARSILVALRREKHVH
ncbi:MAG: glycerol-3-phosphate dehydrogenase subunit GlpB [Caldilineae bacterium]|nr:MAG: glycerol-3-phosphate dehydrogenase subunit GlpB [Caldilineae bacterium]